ncbi:MAG: S46 family peptidase, partial [Arenicella sp.]|nr:S46 family peptidase [Arenicella sp.]
PKAQRVAAFDKALGINSDTVERQLSEKLDNFYAKTVLNDVESRLALMAATPGELEKNSDPFMQLAVALYDEDMAQENANKDRDGRYALLEPQYMSAIIAWQKEQGFTAYPDANSNLRVSYGNVMGGSPKDGLRYTAFTRLEGIVEKDTGEVPFNAPKSQLELIKSADYGDYELKSLGSVPVNFMSDLDITGGNSGSATLNGKGELVGLVFDGTIESVNSDWDFDSDITRAIHVDSRYMLWVMEKVDNAEYLINEMDVIRR